MALLYYIKALLYYTILYFKALLYYTKALRRRCRPRRFYNAPPSCRRPTTSPAARYPVPVTKHDQDGQVRLVTLSGNPCCHHSTGEDTILEGTLRTQFLKDCVSATDQVRPARHAVICCEQQTVNRHVTQKGGGGGVQRMR